MKMIKVFIGKGCYLLMTHMTYIEALKRGKADRRAESFRRRIEREEKLKIERDPLRIGKESAEWN